MSSSLDWSQYYPHSFTTSHLEGQKRQLITYQPMSSDIFKFSLFLLPESLTLSINPLQITSSINSSLYNSLLSKYLSFSLSLTFPSFSPSILSFDRPTLFILSQVPSHSLSQSTFSLFLSPQISLNLHLTVTSIACVFD